MCFLSARPQKDLARRAKWSNSFLLVSELNLAYG